MDKKYLFENEKPAKALAVMAIPTIASQLIILIYNIADTWFIGRTGNPYMIAASSLALTVYLAVCALANVFGTGGGALMSRLTGEGKLDDAKKVCSYSVALSVISAALFCLAVFIFMEPLLRFLGAGENTLMFGKQYLLYTTVLGGIPTVLSMSMPQLIRNAGYAKHAGIGVGLGSILNVLLDPLFMFVLLPKGYEVLGAAVATMLSNIVSLAYFIIVFRKLKDDTTLTLPARIEKIGSINKRSLYSVGIPAAIAIFLFDLVTIVLNRLTASYGDIPLAAVGIVLKLERIPLNTGLGICLGMVPLVAYNYGAKNHERMKQFLRITAISVTVFTCLCTAIFWLFSSPIIRMFIDSPQTVSEGNAFMHCRCLSLPFMMIGYVVTNYMNAIDRGKISFLLAIVRHIVLIIPISMIMNRLWALPGLMWSQLVSDLIGSVFILFVFIRISGTIGRDFENPGPVDFD